MMSNNLQAQILSWNRSQFFNLTAVLVSELFVIQGKRECEQEAQTDKETERQGDRESERKRQRRQRDNETERQGDRERQNG